MQGSFRFSLAAALFFYIGEFGDTNAEQQEATVILPPNATLVHGKAEEDKNTTSIIENNIVNATLEASNSTLGLERTDTGDFHEQGISLLDAVSVKVLVAEEDSIALVDLSTTKRQPLFLEREGLNVYSVDFHWNKNLVFFAANNTIFRAAYIIKESVYSLTPIVSQHVKGNVRLAVDWIHDKLYWLCDTHQTIEMVDFDGNNRRLLFDNIKSFRFPNNIAVDPFEKTLFFISDYALFKSDLDGSNVKHISLDSNTRGNSDWGITNIALDRKNKNIFLTGKIPQMNVLNSTVFIRKVDYKGMGTVNNLLGDETKWMDIYSMEVFNDTLYFVNFNNSGVDSVYMVPITKDELLPHTLVYVPRFTDNGIWSIRVVHPCVQMNKSEECEYNIGPS